ncbi:MAG: M15 family metallopeptidase [Treponema sp.]|nr:M15 family metallopeptidase [Treponema sp.]
MVRMYPLMIACLLLLGIGAGSFGLGTIQQPQMPQSKDSVETEGVQTLIQFEDLVHAASGEVPQEHTQELVAEPPRGEQVMKALAAAYPDRIGPAVYQNGDWAVSIRGVFYYYAQGRLLPEDLRTRVSEYDPQPFYQYAEELPPWTPPGPEETARLKSQADRRRLHPPKRSLHFYDALWRASTKESAYERVKTIRFLGHNVLVHYAILEELALVEERIYREARTNPQVRQWINGIASISGWNWRNIADSESRSFHAYGAALDLLPKSSSLATYWLWTARTTSEWWSVPYEKRFHPPDAVIKVFEAYGFIWGGKWFFYDTMHFEYRPEILFLSNMPLTDLR